MLRRSLLLGMVFLPIFAMASWSLSPMDAQLSSKTQRSVVFETTSHSSVKHYLKVNVYKVELLNNERHYVLLHNPSKEGVVVAPKRFILPANGTRSIKFSYTKSFPSSSVKTYAVQVVESAMPSKSDEAERASYGHITYNLAFEALVALQPNALRPKFLLARHEKSLTIKNDGNVFAAVSVLDKDCAWGEKSCPKLSVFHAFPGQVETLLIPKSHKIVASYTVLGKVKNID